MTADPDFPGSAVVGLGSLVAFGGARYVKVVVYDYQSERVGSAIIHLP